jgi:hypothetical protein
MRHFLIRELVPLPVSIARLASRLQATGSGLAPVGAAGAAEGGASTERATVRAEPLAPIAPAAEEKLDPTPLAEREPILRERQEPPCRRFLDMELGPW